MMNSKKKPNILLIVTDQEYAHQELPQGVILNNRDRLRSRGVTFNNHQVTTTVCTPSCSVMWTSQHTPFTGMFDNTNFAWIDDMRDNPNNPDYDEQLLVDLNTKLNTLITEELGEDKALIDLPSHLGGPNINVLHSSASESDLIPPISINPCEIV